MLNVATIAHQYRPMIDTRRANAARVWNYWLGGKDNYPIDQELGEQIRVRIPAITDLARASRGFGHRAVRHLTGAHGIRQFLDIGTGLPMTPHTHHLAQALAPECRIVYVDHDPLVLAHARALLTGTPPGRTDHLHADLRDPDTILREAARTLDLTRPVALMLLGVLNFIVEDDQAHAVVTRLLDALPAGSYLLLSHPTAEVHREAMLEYQRLWNERATPPITIRSPQQLTRFFTPLELLKPGVVPCSLWRPDPTQIGSPVAVDAFCGVGRKPMPPQCFQS
ncbi:MAG: SAM-dependent methyltransferase [Pseudonocardiaceae bacterium]